MIPFYRRDDQTIYHGSWEDTLPILEARFDLIVTSPPYNLGNTTGGGVKRLGHYRKTDGMQKRGGRRSHWDHAAIAQGYDAYDDNLPHATYVAWQHRLLAECWRLLSDRGAIFYNHKPRILGGRLIAPMSYVPPALLPQVRQEVIWARAGGINTTPAFYCNTHERLIIIAKDGWRLTGKPASSIGDVWYVPQERDNDHPAPFPLGIPMRALETCRPRSVLDPHLGSGTTLVAAKALGIPGVGIDRSRAYCEQAVGRLAQTSIIAPAASAAQAALIEQ